MKFDPTRLPPQGREPLRRDLMAAPPGTQAPQQEGEGEEGQQEGHGWDSSSFRTSARSQ